MNWLLATAFWVAVSCAVVAVVWSAAPLVMLGTAAISLVLSIVLGNGNERR